VSYETQVLAINVGLNNREETTYQDSSVHGYGISLNLLVEPGYLLNTQPALNEVAAENEIMLIEGKLSVSF
jgi:hypothetical protein